MTPYDLPIPDHAIDSLQAEGQWQHDAWSVLNDVRPLEICEPDRSRFTWADARAFARDFLGALIVFVALLVACVAVSGMPS